MNTTLKQLAKKARNRLKTAGEFSATKSKTDCSTAYLNGSSSYIFVANVRQIEDDPLFYKIKKILEHSATEIVINPIASLIDTKIFNVMNENERERYILKLTKRYNQIKDYLIDNKLLNVVEEQSV